jgi:hypothetical protein
MLTIGYGALGIRLHWGLLSSLGCATLVAMGAVAGCSSDNASSPSNDAGYDSSTTPDGSSGGDSGGNPEGGYPDAGGDDLGDIPDAGGDDSGNIPDDGGGDGGALSARAQAGLAASPFPVPTTGETTAQLEQIGMGSYIVNAVSSCPDCHNNPAAAPGSGYLAGGAQYEPVLARNLTSDPNHGLRMSEAQFLEVMQTGKDQKLSPTDGGAAVALIVMPWEDFRWMSTTDMKNIYAYLQTVPADANDVPLIPSGAPTLPVPTTFTDGEQATAPTLPPETGDAPLFIARGRAVQALNEPAAVGSLSTADQAAYGRGAYLVAQAICYNCHTNPERLSPGASTKLNTAQWLTGGRVFQTPAPLAPIVQTTASMTADLLGATNGFIFYSDVDETVFTTTLSKHIHGDTPGNVPLAWPMPLGFTKLVPDDLHALWTYLHNQTPITGANDKPTQDAVIYCASATGVCPSNSTCDLATKSCVSTTCASDMDCRVCQTCVMGGDAGGQCAEPAPQADGGANACLANGI